MKKRFLCLLFAILMVSSACLLTGCSKKTTADQLQDISDDASESAVTLTMFMITEKHVPTQEEVNAIKASKGESSIEYLEANKTMLAYANVAEALDDITKAKFRTHLITYFYTIEEYQKVEQLMEINANSSKMKKEAEDAYDKYRRQKKKEGIQDLTAIESMFYAEYPQYVEYLVTTAPSNTEDTTAVETITDKYGNDQIKYPDAKSNQVDIICVCGYNNYIKYIQKGWLSALDSDLETNSKAILTYVNEKFLKSAMVNGSTYGIPNNTTIGEYTYLLIDKERFDHYEYDYESLPSGSPALYSTDFLDFLKDIQRYDAEYAPITGDLSMTNELFWSLNYEYDPVGVFSEVTQLNKDLLYFFKVAPDSDEYRLLTPYPDPVITYATVKETAFTGKEFEEGTHYYTKGSDGYYTLAEEYVAGTSYYTLEFTDVVPEEGKDFEEFEEGVVYFEKIVSPSLSYLPVYTFKPNTEYFVVSDAEFDYETFSVFGSVLALGSTNETQVYPNLINNALYRNQILALKAIEEKGYYDASALTYDKETGKYTQNKKFASAIIKGDASLADTYGEDYYMVVLEYPRANAEELCSNLIGVSSSCKNVSRAMQVITYINTNTEFRNLLQYGIEGQDYTVENLTDPATGAAYKAIKRTNSYYSMDINKTGNVFIAYPEEHMNYTIWTFGKQQNSNAVYNPMIEFNLSEYVSKIDFTKVDYFKNISKKYEELINACATEEELKNVLDQMKAELSANVYYSREITHGAVVNEDDSITDGIEMLHNKYGLYNHYMQWWVTTDYFVPVEVN